ncbi:tyrosine-type recombinase/integrase [Klebsiella aerogenes]|uniref:tyrosine-type recombinase/integrase n=1 Tax=Klebsiella aerogenes TaxID=548 RepID=UPI00190EC3ED|nr:site-specific integrase [Klebsiella aerogenes]MBK0633394.1 tyrosine-type recombinase/integrase [Klebsiella aerogenes]
MLYTLEKNYKKALNAKKQTRNNLTEERLKALKPKDKRYYVWHDTGMRGDGRVGVGIARNGLKEFYFRTFTDGKATFVKLGRYPETSLSEAIEKADYYRHILQKPTKQIWCASLADLFNDYISYNESIGRRSMKTTRTRLNQVLKSQYIIPNLAANKITSDMITRCLAEFIERGAIAGSNKVRANLHAAFNFGIHYDNDPANINKPNRYEIKFNPVSCIPKQRGAEKALDRYLSWDELKTVIESFSLDDNKLPINHNYARLALLCIYSGGQRPYEIATMQNQNIDLVAKTMTITPDISKTENFHVVPLSDSAIDIIKRQREIYPKSFYLFPSATKEGHLLTCEFSKQLRKYCKKMDFPPFTPRDIRRTFKTLAGALGVNIEIRDILQNHKRQGTSARHYDRYQYLKEKQEIIKLWNDTLREL